MSDLKKKNRVDYSKYDEMGTEALEEILRLDFQMSEEAESDIDAILYISEVIARREKNPPDVGAAWEQFNTKYRPYVTDGRSLYDFGDEDGAPGTVSNNSAVESDSRIYGVAPLRRRWRGTRRLVRLAVIAAIMAAFLVVTSATAYALGFDLWGTIAQWTKDTFSFVSTSSEDGAPNPNRVQNLADREYDSLQDALEAYGVKEPLVPMWLPDGFVTEMITVDETSYSKCTVFYTCYKNNERLLAITIYMHEDSNDTNYTMWQKDDAEVDTIIINGQTFYIMSNTGRQCAVWANGPFECSISGDITPDELEKTIESIYTNE